MAYIDWWNRSGPVTLGERFGLNGIKRVALAKGIPGGWWGDWELNYKDQMTFEEYKQSLDIDKNPSGLEKAEGGRIGFRYAGPVKLIETFKTLMKKPNYSLDDAVVAVNKLNLKYSPDKIKDYFKNFVTDKRSMSTEKYLTYIKERIKDTSLPHKANWNKPLMGSPLEVKGFGKRKHVRVSNLTEAEKQLTDEELRLWRAYTEKQSNKVKFARKTAGERIDPVTGDVIKDSDVRSTWLAKAYIRKGIRRARKHNAYKKLSPLEKLKLEFFEKRLDVMGKIIKDNPALLKNKEVMELLETGVNANTGKIIKSPVDFSQIKDRRIWELEHIDPIAGGQTKMRGSFLSNLQVLPASIHKNFKEPAEIFLNKNWGKKEYANEINEILKKARELKITLRVNDVGPVGYKAKFENFLDKADDVFNFYVRDSGAKKLYSETIAEMKPANIKFNWRNLGFKEAPSEEIIQKAITETTRPAFIGIKGAVLTGTAAAVTEKAAAETLETSDEKQEAGAAETTLGDYIKGGAGVATGAAITHPEKAWELTKKVGSRLNKIISPLLTPAASIAAHGPHKPDVTSGLSWVTPAFWNTIAKQYGLEGTIKTLLKAPNAQAKTRIVLNMLLRAGIPMAALPAISTISTAVAGPLLISEGTQWLHKKLEEEGLSGEGGMFDLPAVVDPKRSIGEKSTYEQIKQHDRHKLLSEGGLTGVNRYSQLIK